MKAFDCQENCRKRITYLLTYLLNIESESKQAVTAQDGSKKLFTVTVTCSSSIAST